jgi:hypothetical protein
MKCQRCGIEVTPDNYAPEKVLNWEGEEIWCADCVENNTYICCGCDQSCAEGLHAETDYFGGSICHFCINDGYFDD